MTNPTSEALKRVKPSATLAADAKARELKAQGKNVIGLAALLHDVADPKLVDERIKELSAPYEKPEEAAQFYRGDRGMMAQVEASVKMLEAADDALGSLLDVKA